MQSDALPRSLDPGASVVYDVRVDHDCRAIGERNELPSSSLQVAHNPTCLLVAELAGPSSGMHGRAMEMKTLDLNSFFFSSASLPKTLDEILSQTVGVCRSSFR